MLSSPLIFEISFRIRQAEQLKTRHLSYALVVLTAKSQLCPALYEKIKSVCRQGWLPESSFVAFPAVEPTFQEQWQDERLNLCLLGLLRTL